MLLADLKAEVIKELTGKDLRVAQGNESKALMELYHKYKDTLYKKYGVGTWAQAWECIRKLAVFKMGKRYVRDLLPSEEKEAAEFAEGILMQLLDEGEIDE
nr:MULTISPECIES: hypothetical protein [Bacillaceae]